MHGLHPGFLLITQCRLIMRLLSGTSLSVLLRIHMEDREKEERANLREEKKRGKDVREKRWSKRVIKFTKL
jgi:hypothetical protein